MTVTICRLCVDGDMENLTCSVSCAYGRSCWRQLLG